MMDGYDVSGFREDGTYDVDDRVGNYLIVAGYAVIASDDKREPRKPPTR